VRDLTKAIISLYPKAAWELNGDDYSGLTWKSVDIAKPTEAELIAECDRLHAIYLSTEYKRQRAKAYPSIADQLDLMYHGGYDAWKAAIDAVKQEYPK
jgi:hypothetical protein